MDKNPDHVIEDTSSFKKTIFERRYKIRCGRDLLKCLYKYKAKYFRSIIKYFKRLHGGLNFYLDVQTDLQKADKDGNVQSASPYFSSGTRRLTDMSEYDALFEKAIVKIIDAFEKWVSEGSGWTMKRINSITLKIAKYSPIRGKSYIKTPQKLVGKHSIINIQNEDTRCFLYCIVAALHPVENNKLSVYSYTKKLEELKANKKLI